MYWDLVHCVHRPGEGELRKGISSWRTLWLNSTAGVEVEQPGFGLVWECAVGQPFLNNPWWCSSTWPIFCCEVRQMNNAKPIRLAEQSYGPVISSQPPSNFVYATGAGVLCHVQVGPRWHWVQLMYRKFIQTDAMASCCCCTEIILLQYTGYITWRLSILPSHIYI